MPADLPHKVILVLGIVALVKCAVFLAAPSLAKRITGSWIRFAANTPTILGALCLLLAVCIWAVVLARQPLVHWLLILLGAWFVWAATIYFRPDVLRKVADAMILKRNPGAIRAMCVGIAIVAAFLIWVGVKGI